MSVQSLRYGAAYNSDALFLQDSLTNACVLRVAHHGHILSYRLGLKGSACAVRTRCLLRQQVSVALCVGVSMLSSSSLLVLVLL